jgi:hypothetical protein
MRTSRDVLDALTDLKRSGTPLQVHDAERLARGRGGRKQDIVAALAQAVGRRPPAMSTGSTEPREIFEYIDEGLALGLAESGARTKPRYARGIVDAAALEVWLPTYESAGGTITLQGLKAVLRAVLYLLRD